MVRALIAALLVPALGAGASLGVLHAMAAYTGFSLSDVYATCAPARATLLLSDECQPVQLHYWLLLLSAAAAAAGIVLALLCLVGGRTQLSLFSFRGLLAAPVLTAQWIILVLAAYLIEAQWFDVLPAATLLPAAALGAGLALWLLMALLSLHPRD